MDKIFEVDFGGKPLKVEPGLAPQANASFKVTYGETVILVTVVMDKDIKDGADFLPLSVEYEEKLYAAGRIKGSRFIKREGKATDEAILTGRVIDRIIRPRFDQRIRNSIQVVVTVFSFDGINDPDIPAIIGTSLALSVSDIPWDGPLAAVRVAKRGDDFLLNPNYEERSDTVLDLTIAGDGELFNMIELGSKGVSNDEIMNAVYFAKKEIQKNILFQKDIIKKLQKPKRQIDFLELDKNVIGKLDKFLEANLPQVLEEKNKLDFKEALEKVRQGFFQSAEEIMPESKTSFQVRDALEIYFEKAIDSLVHRNILTKNKRPDGRKLDELRKIECRVGVLPRTHGSALFKRGLTHVLSVVTLAGPGEEQLLDGMEVVGTKRFMHHYNFPPYSVGETGPFRGPGRREIGHGALAEKAVKPTIPKKADFPYTIRIVSEVLSSNGSSSMASTCGSSLSLFDAGVPVQEAIAGIAMGLMIDESHQNYKILTDIQGPEDHYGDMDLKVAGSFEKVTAMQMDVKIKGITEKILKEALQQSQEARQIILKKMATAISSPRKELSPFAPKIIALKISREKIGELIGSGGKTVNGIIEKTKTTINIEDDGYVYISGDNLQRVQEAAEIVKEITREYHPGEIYQGTITRLLDFGVFVQLSPNHEGLIHISKLSPHYIKNVRDVVSEGDKVEVEVIEIDELGRINLKLLKNLSKKETPSSSKKPFINDRSHRRPPRSKSNHGFRRNFH